MIGALRGIRSPIGFPTRNLRYTGCKSNSSFVLFLCCSSRNKTDCQKLKEKIHTNLNQINAYITLILSNFLLGKTSSLAVSFISFDLSFR